MSESTPWPARRDARAVAYFRGATVDGVMLHDAVLGLAARLPSARYVVNLCENRYYFLLVWLAACLREQLLLLPSDHSPGTLAQLAEDYPEHYTADDRQVALWLSSSTSVAVACEWSVIPERVVAIAFTSGSTGRPQAHPKRWGTLWRNAELAAKTVLGGAGVHIVATVPPQHMFGLETSVLSLLAAGCVPYDERPFFPRDVQAALESVAAPRTLVTTPTHLQALRAADTSLPPLQCVVSATAPLTRELAEDIEGRWSTTVREIYGCTEAGIVAWRCTSTTESWQTFDGGRVETTDDCAWYSAPQLPERVRLQDLIEPLSDTEFHLRGRANDMVKVAGKRTSLEGLTQQLRAIAGVVDAIVFQPASDARPAALVVAPGLTSQQIAHTLSEHIDPVFVPRPLVRVLELPRNALGKLPQDALLRALKAGDAR